MGVEEAAEDPSPAPPRVQHTYELAWPAPWAGGPSPWPKDSVACRCHRGL